jgi:hypothetical protein
MAKKKIKPKSVKETPAPRTPRVHKKLKEAQETQRFFLVLAVATMILVFFLYLIFARK